MFRRCTCREWGGRGLVVIVAAVALLTPGEAATTASGRSRPTVDMVARVIPTVVSIVAHRLTTPPHETAMQTASFPHLKESVGSGFVVDPAGFIATNRHVIDGAYEIAVTFSDGRAVEAKLFWTSTVVDVAFLKVDVGHPLPAAVLAPNQSMEIGERVFAVGNPLGLGTSVSAGIVSALNRNIKESPYDAFIQTDAAINHGSSGGPLFNEDGEVVGMNTALYSSIDNGGSQGLGFAIPGCDLTFLIDELKRYKQIRPGWLGASTQKLTPDMAEAMSYPGYYGAIVAAVKPNSPASSIGLHAGDIIQSFDGQPIYDTTTLSRAAALSLDKTVTLGVWHDGQLKKDTVKIAEAPQPHGVTASSGLVVGPRFASAADLGLTLAPVDDQLRERYGLGSSARGLLVMGVSGESAAQEAGLRAGDVIVSAQMIPIATPDQFEGLISEQARKGRRRFIILVQATGGERWVALPLRL